VWRILCVEGGRSFHVDVNGVGQADEWRPLVGVFAGAGWTGERHVPWRDDALFQGEVVRDEVDRKSP